ncbi:uncharacterized protein MYCFIDRAFT_177339 [Pseudocercospora fijiensis CIRAD86]|uniref:Uncharacterized protein n=1 Tax=Pseudocercospora fijiensis (strain CIRAD86) TaxID=383855 RepID=M2ZMR3_PSEFD|nr:uncharacterized protein MYCFIDRAFT_177339 [Pseudocercospora fijiensis CIRAD86]EME80389.1 hypothetical protein MYCFIDRAFT_177339 [Pseudocercospora fijiensis CIRAD86]
MEVSPVIVALEAEEREPNFSAWVHCHRPLVLRQIWPYLIKLATFISIIWFIL